MPRRVSELKYEPIEETSFKKRRENAMKVQLLVYGGKVLVQRLNLRKPGQKFKVLHQNPQR